MSCEEFGLILAKSLFVTCDKDLMQISLSFSATFWFIYLGCLALKLQVWLDPGIQIVSSRLSFQWVNCLCLFLHFLLVGLIFSRSDIFCQSGRKIVTDIHHAYIFMIQKEEKLSLHLHFEKKNQGKTVGSALVTRQNHWIHYTCHYVHWRQYND